MTRVLFVSHTFPPPGESLANLGGMQRVAVDLSQRLDAHAEIELALHVSRTTWSLAVPRTVGFVCGLLSKLPAMVERRQIDVVLFSSVTSILPLAVIGSRLRRTGVRVAAIAHGLDVTAASWSYQALLRRALGHVDRVFPVSRATAETLVARGVERGRVKVLPNGIDVDRFAGACHRAGSEDLASDSDVAAPRSGARPQVLLSVGRLVERKGFAWFIEQVMPRLPAHVHYWIVGDGPARGVIDRTVRTHALEDRVRVLGRVSEAQLAAAYREADLFVMPNVPVEHDMEGFGVVMLEAGLSGLYTVASDLEGIRDVVCHGRNGALAPARDAEGFRRRILDELGDEARLTERSRGAAEYVRSTFAWDRVAQRYASELSELACVDGGNAHSEPRRPSAV
ncbi:MAG: glycosyltransferase family 4 protein [Myxococcales bacterium FL481]|nr:MAG: glycosyltransferase family 4 protein [Myxococcales bacterium FL481]